MSIKLLDLSQKIEFIPEHQDKGKGAKPLKIYLKTLDWFEKLEVTELAQVTGTGKDGKPIINVNTKDRDKWFEYMIDKIISIDNGGEDLPVTTDTVRSFPPLIGLELVKRIFELSQGLSEKQEKK